MGRSAESKEVSRLCRLVAVLTLGGAAGCLPGCDKKDEPSSASTDKAKPTTPAAQGGPTPLIPKQVRVIAAPSQATVEAAVKDELEGAKKEGRDVIVYVGAPWCEPCKKFHHAVERGELDDKLPNLTLIEFNLDEDRDRLSKAGYVSQFIPMFALPRADGHASGKYIEGSIKGDGAVQEIIPRLTKLLGK